jgi:hypothetical protein
LPALLKDEGIEWIGTADEKMEILRRAIARLDADKLYFQNTFKSRSQK